MQRPLIKSKLLWAGIIGGLLYCSWPLGFILNPEIAHHSLVSQLEASGQPYNWVFIGLDVLAGITTVVLGLLLLQKKRLPKWHIALGLGLAAFGAMVILAAVVPVPCDPSEASCGSIWHHPTLVIHGIASIGSVLALFLALLLVAHNARVISTTRALRVALISLMSAWVIFGIGALLEISLKIHSNLSQYYFISICSLSIAAIIGAYEVMIRSRQL